MNRGLEAAAGLVVAANIVVLAGVAYNRSQAIERVELNERELRLGSTNEDDSGVSLRFEWARAHWSALFEDWLTESKLREAGFDLPPTPAKGSEWRALLPRQTFVVLEIGGASWQKWQDEEEVKRKEAKLPEVTGLPPSRLIAIDLGRDADSLRRKYPDLAKHIIMRAVLRVSWNAWTDPNRTVKEGWRGYVSELLPSGVHAPRPFSDMLRPWVHNFSPTPRYAVTLCFGRRHEPWIESIRPL